MPPAGLLDRLCESQDALACPAGVLAQSRDGWPVCGARHQAGRGVRWRPAIEKGVSHRWDTPLSALQQND